MHSISICFWEKEIVVVSPREKKITRYQDHQIPQDRQILSDHHILQDLQILHDYQILQVLQMHQVLQTLRDLLWAWNKPSEEGVKLSVLSWTTLIPSKQSLERILMAGELLCKRVCMINRRIFRKPAERLIGSVAFWRHMPLHGMGSGKDRHWQDSVLDVVWHTKMIWCLVLTIKKLKMNHMPN